MIIDIYTHIFPKDFFNELVEHSKGLGSLAERMKAVKSIIDLDQRFREMDVQNDYRQIIALPHPALESVASPAEAARLAKIANDGLAELCSRYPTRFPAFVASVSLTDVDAAITEANRAISQLGASGIQIYSNVSGQPLDEPKFEPIFAAMAKHDRPIWLHPARTAAMTDYASESKSRYEMWWCFGWPYETSVAMSRLVFAGLFDRYPRLSIITHHLGGMIPYFDGRVNQGMAYLGSRTADEDYSEVLRSLRRPHLDYFKMFFADTAMFGGAIGLPSGLAFFGSDHVVFASDAPFGPIKQTVDAVHQLNLEDDQRRRILLGNAEKLLRMTFN